ncbi:MAG: L,D-transpeptidase family protein [Candidatus Aureabacteria bacterium]|nr:L,D-transpeptidase family protein [Candidatus Auribacterota bacterium]
MRTGKKLGILVFLALLVAGGYRVYLALEKPKAAQSAPVAVDPCRERLARADLLDRQGDLAGAFEEARRAAGEYPGSPAFGEAQCKMGELYVRLLFSPGITPGTEEYVIRRGDTLQRIAKRYGTTVDLLKEMNRERLKSGRLQPDQRIKVNISKFSVVVSKSANTLTLKADDRMVKIYPVGTGKQGSTPAGEFKITDKVVEPDWYKPGGGRIPYGDPGNLLGTRWIAIDCRGYGIHGTWEPETIGKKVSAGCVRMHNKDVEELFTMLPVGTPVTIVD